MQWGLTGVGALSPLEELHWGRFSMSDEALGERVRVPSPCAWTTAGNLLGIMVCPGFPAAVAPEGLGGWVLLTAFLLSLLGGPAPTQGTGTPGAVRYVCVPGWCRWVGQELRLHP